MKIERLIGILAVLLQTDKVTAPYLAEKFEVSRRTIGRDVEALCKAGIPIVTEQGVGGGISIMEGYRVDRAVFTGEEMQAILAGLRSLDSVSGGNRYKLLMDKLQVGSSEYISSDQHVFINLASWSAGRLRPKISLLQEAMEERRRVGFRYFAPSGESSRMLEPYLLVFQWSSWYVWGYCCGKKNFRLFKLARMEGLELTDERFEKREAPDFVMANPVQLVAEGGTGVSAKVRFAPSAKWRLIDEYGVGAFEEREDGWIWMVVEWSDQVSFLNWLLSFRDQAELVEPLELREEFKKILGRMGEHYA